MVGVYFQFQFGVPRRIHSSHSWRCYFCIPQGTGRAYKLTWAQDRFNRESSPFFKLLRTTNLDLSHVDLIRVFALIYYSTIFSKMSASVSTVMPPNPSRLLNLPGELRNVIFEYALSEASGLLLVEIDDPPSPKRFMGCRHNDKNEEANQLKYVCRQLHAETRGLGLKLNELSVKSEDHILAFQRFLETCSSKQRQQIRQVSLVVNFEFGGLNCTIRELLQSSLVQFCIMHPRCNVTIRLSNFNSALDFRRWILVGSSAQYFLHRAWPDFLPLFAQECLQKGFPAELVPVPSNLKLLPAEQVEGLDHEIQAEPSIGLFTPDEVLTLIKNWCKDGF